MVPKYRVASLPLTRALHNLTVSPPRVSRRALGWFVPSLTIAWSSHAQTSNPPTTPEVTVSAPRGLTSGATAPLLQLSPADLESYGVDTLSDLVDALKPMTRSSRSDQTPVVLINGHLAGQVEFDNLPREAVERVEVLPESVALQYGFSENQRVLNFVLREHYRAMPTRLTEAGATEGGDRTTAVDASLVRLEDEARITLLGSYWENAWLRESDRGIEQPDSFDRTLSPNKSEGKVAATISRSILGISSSLETSFDVIETKSLQGLAGPDLLHQNSRQNTARVAGQLTGQWGHFVWGATGSYVHIGSNSSGGTGLDAGGDLLVDRTDSSLNAGNLQFSLSGPVASLPAGLVVANAKFGFQYQGFGSDDAFSGDAGTRSNLVRTVRTGSINASVPIADRDHGVLPLLGELAATVNVTLDGVSSFGALWSQSYGIDWVPIKKVHLDAIFTDHRTAPTVQQVLAPPIVTPNVEMFDFVAGETVFVATIGGGAPNLRASDNKVASFGLALGPFLGKTTFSAHYEQNRIRNAVGLLPPLTSDVELAFPERFIRNADGTLTEVDDRSVNLQRQHLNDLKWGFNVWYPLGTASGPSPNRLEFSAFDTWYLRDQILIRDGIPQLDLLNGAPSDVAGGQPRHRIDLRGILYKDGFGWVVSGTWRSATSVISDPSSPDSLSFSALGTLDSRMFVDLARLPYTRDAGWAKGTRASLVILNVLNRRQRVLDESGGTPLAFSPGYLDPAGRTLWVTVRKVF
jgi:hypothetical protein